MDFLLNLLSSDIPALLCQNAFALRCRRADSSHAQMPQKIKQRRKSPSRTTDMPTVPVWCPLSSVS